MEAGLMLSDQERRVLEELELSFAGDAVEPDRSAFLPPPARRRTHRGSAAGVLRTAGEVLTGALWIGLFLAGAFMAAFALGLAGAMGWGSWRALSRLAGAGRSERDQSRPPRGVRGDRCSRLSQSAWLRRRLERLVEEA
jgi:hypothetical protein